MNVERILVAFDGSDAARAALLEAARVASTTGASVDVVTVLPEASVPVLEAAAAEAVELLRERNVRARLHTPTGDPATEILRVARDGAYEAIYLGSRPAGSLARALMGSVSEAVVRAFPGTIVVDGRQEPSGDRSGD